MRYTKMTTLEEEAKALKEAFAKARAEGKIFNVTKWKLKREQKANE